MGLWHWAARQGTSAAVNDSTLDALDHQHGERAPPCLLIQLAQLPYELVEKIAADVYLTPQQAAGIHFRSASSCTSPEYTRSERDEMLREDMLDQDLDDGGKSSSSYWQSDLSWEDDPYLSADE